MSTQSPQPPLTTLIPAIRTASRALVRELGFMQPTIANTPLSASAVHAILEIGSRTATLASSLSITLNLDKSSVSRMLKKLVEAGEVGEKASLSDGREKTLFLTPQGVETRRRIDEFADAQVGMALGDVEEGERMKILEGLEKYARALRGRRGELLPLPSLSPPLSPPLPSTGMTATSIVPNVAATIVAGYQPGILARALDMQMQYYSQTSNFGLAFEHSLATDLGELLSRIEHPDNEAWAAIASDQSQPNKQIVGTIFIDGQGLGAGKAHLRAFIVDSQVRGGGVGRRLLEEAVRFADHRGFQETRLWTFRGLGAARRLYEWVGFRLVEEGEEKRWGQKLLVQQMVRRKGGVVGESRIG